jgi:hypothetical protein
VWYLCNIAVKLLLSRERNIPAAARIAGVSLCVYGTVTIHAASFAIGLISAAAILTAIAVSPILPDREEHVGCLWIVSARVMLSKVEITIV